jgi:SAM-dependent methyltransferase
MADDDDDPRRMEVAPSARDTLRRIYHRLPQPPHSNYTFRRVDPFALLADNAVVFNIGSKDTPLQLPRGIRMVTVDIDPSVRPDIVADAHDLHMIPSGSADGILVISVLHHCKKPWVVVPELYRILKPGGIIYANIPFMFPFHVDQDDYWRVSHHGVDVLFEQFAKIDSGYNRGPASSMTELLVHFNALLFSFGSRTLYGINVDLFRWLLFWVKYLDVLLAKHPAAHVIYTGTYFLGRKGAQA